MLLDASEPLPQLTSHRKNNKDPMTHTYILVKVELGSTGEIISESVKRCSLVEVRSLLNGKMIPGLVNDERALGRGRSETNGVMDLFCVVC